MEEDSEADQVFERTLIASLNPRYTFEVRRAPVWSGVVRGSSESRGRCECITSDSDSPGRLSARSRLVLRRRGLGTARMKR